MQQLVNIREATEEDVSSIFQLANQLSETISINEQYLSSNFHSFLDSEKHCLLVATEKEVVIGYLSGYFHKAIYANGQVAYVDEIVVDGLYRDKQVGTQLMAKFEQIAKRHECILVSLATFGAKGFYEKLGYGSKAAYYKKYLP